VVRPACTFSQELALFSAKSGPAAPRLLLPSPSFEVGCQAELHVIV